MFWSSGNQHDQQAHMLKYYFVSNCYYKVFILHNILETWRGFATPSGELSLWFTMGQYTISQHFGCE